MRSAGPFSALPPMMRLTVITGAPRRRAAAIASAIPGTARIGPSDTMGFDGPMTIRSVSARRPRARRRSARRIDPVETDLADLRTLVAMDEVLLEVEPAVVGQDLRADRRVGHRQDSRREPERRPAGASTASVSGRAGPDPGRPGDVRREVAVTEPEPALLAIRAQLVHDASRSRPRSPSHARWSKRSPSMYRMVSWSGMTSRPWRSHVVAGVRDDREAGRRQHGREARRRAWRRRSRRRG